MPKKKKQRRGFSLGSFLLHCRVWKPLKHAGWGCVFSLTMMNCLQLINMSRHMARGHGLMGCQSMCLPFECAGMIPPPRPLRRAVILRMHLKRALIQCHNVHEQILVDAAQHGGLHIRRLSPSAANKRSNIWNDEVLLCRLIYAVTFIMSCETRSLEHRMHSYSNQAEM